MKEYHIGQEIRKEIDKQGIKPGEFAEMLHRERQTVYDIFKRAHIATDRLMEISQVLGRDFFKELSEVYANGGAPTTDDETTVAEGISLLMPADELHVIADEQLMDVFEEFFVAPRTKPLVVLFPSEKNAEGAIGKRFKDYVKEMADMILGAGQAKLLDRVKKGEELLLSAQAERLAQFPHHVLVIPFSGHSCCAGFDDIILEANNLVKATGKYVVVLCCVNNEVGSYGHVEYRDDAEKTFETWKEVAHLFVADDIHNNFARRQELAVALKGRGHLDRFKCCYDDEEEWAEATRLFREICNMPTLFKVEYEEHPTNPDILRRAHISWQGPTAEDRKALGRVADTITTKMWVDVWKESGKVVDHVHTLANMFTRRHNNITLPSTTVSHQI